MELRAPQLAWKGRVDLLLLSHDACEIIDFKTGAPDDSHAFQIRTYALLWSRDTSLNPARRRANRLALQYSGAEVEVEAPSDSQLDDLESELVERALAARLAVAKNPPEARPTPAACRYCGVRQLCTEYWTSAVQSDDSIEAQPRHRIDVEVTVSGRHGLSSWDVQIAPSQHVAAAGPALLRTGRDVELRPGDRLRVLDATIAVDEDSKAQPAVITLGAFSEVYAVA